jgi:hypothetical protein
MCSEASDVGVQESDSPRHDNDDVNFFVDGEDPKIPGDKVSFDSEEVNFGEDNTLNTTITDNSGSGSQTEWVDEEGDPLDASNTGVAEVTVTVTDKKGNEIQSGTAELDNETNKITYTVDGSNHENTGEHTATIKAEDLAGNTKTRDTTFNVTDTVNVKLVSPSDGLSDVIGTGSTLKLTAEDIDDNPVAANWTTTLTHTDQGQQDSDTAETNNDEDYTYTIPEDVPTGNYNLDVTADWQDNTGTFTHTNFEVATSFNVNLANQNEFTGQSFAVESALSPQPEILVERQGGDPVTDADSVSITCLDQNQDETTHTLNHDRNGVYVLQSGDACYTPSEYTTDFTLKADADKDNSIGNWQHTFTTRKPPSEAEQNYQPDTVITNPRGACAPAPCIPPFQPRISLR